MNTMTLTVKDQVAIARQLLASRTSEFVATLPVATQVQVDACVEAALAVVVRPEVAVIASGRNQKYRLTEEQCDQVAAARVAHKVEINTAERRAEAGAAVIAAKKLTSYKLRTKKDGTVVLSVGAEM